MNARTRRKRSVLRWRRWGYAEDAIRDRLVADDAAVARFLMGAAVHAQMTWLVRLVSNPDAVRDTIEQIRATEAAVRESLEAARGRAQ